jgi:hypothetical protein
MLVPEKPISTSGKTTSDYTTTSSSGDSPESWRYRCPLGMQVSV